MDTWMSWKWTVLFLGGILWATSLDCLLGYFLTRNAISISLKIPIWIPVIHDLFLPQIHQRTMPFRLHNHSIIACLMAALILPSYSDICELFLANTFPPTPSLNYKLHKRREYLLSYIDESFDISRYPRTEQRNSVVSFNWYFEFKRYSWTLVSHFFDFPHFCTWHHSATSAGAIWVLFSPSKHTLAYQQILLFVIPG